MDTERLKINAEIYGTKAKAKIRLLVGFVGLVLIGLGAWNFLAVPALRADPIAPYRMGYLIASAGYGSTAFYVGDVVLMTVGAILVWLS